MDASPSPGADRMTVTQKQRGLSGFPEWLPQYRRIELDWLNKIGRVFESFGYAPVETAAVEEISSLLAKGSDTDKEIYALRRLQDTSLDKSKLALHYDLTVPFARYVAQNRNDLVFPFKRYSIQKAWRGERPQDGRFREFYQCDIDVVDNEKLSMVFDAEVPTIMCEALRKLNLGPVTLNINNRKVLQGFYSAVGVEDVVGAIRCIDKIDKAGPENTLRSLVDDIGLSSQVAERCIALASIRTTDVDFVDRVHALGIQSELLQQGIDELKFLAEMIDHGSNVTVAFDLSIARGFDYYTGSVYEFKMDRFPNYPSICSGGRYGDLVGSFSRAKLPGVGMSLGLTRIFSKAMKEGLISEGAKTPSEVLVIYLPGVDWQSLSRRTKALRGRGINAECYHEPAKLQAQIRYADRKGIRFAYFLGSDGQSDEVKDLATGDQVAVNTEWHPALV